MRKTRQRKLKAAFKKVHGRAPAGVTFVEVQVPQLDNEGKPTKRMTTAYIPSEWRRLKKGRIS